MAVHEHSSELGNVTMPLRAPQLFCALIAVAELAAPPSFTRSNIRWHTVQSMARSSIPPVAE